MKYDEVIHTTTLEVHVGRFEVTVEASETIAFSHS